MRSTAAVLFVLSVAAASCRGPSGAGGRPSAPNANLRTAAVGFPDGTRIQAEVADSPQTRETGYMFRSELKPDDGMLFVFDGEETLQFWMKNTLVDLDMIFIGADKRVTTIHRDVPRSALDTPEANLARRSGKAKYVLELPAGGAKRRGLKEGDLLELGV